MRLYSIHKNIYINNIRVSNEIIRISYKFRPATIADSENLLKWRNSIQIRSISKSKSYIDEDSHKSWLTKSIEDPNCILLIIENFEEAVGVVRFDCNGDKATISIYRVPESTYSRGLVKQSTQWLKENRNEIEEIIACILPTNTSSISAFNSAGYRQSTNYPYNPLEE
tara:strand:+ start:204 stop:707 length:504 start_codon:yes stop_codon:yes gene_type:complete